MNFVRYFWDVLEPGTKLVEGWTMEAICLHLEHLTLGNIPNNRLLINVPPGFSKSLITNVFWPAWVWGPMNMPTKRFIAFSYAAHLTVRDNRKFLLLLQSQKYQAMYGDRFALGQQGAVEVSNDKLGKKFATSVSGVSTGERGDYVVCLPGDALVKTSEGELPIKHIVDSRLNVRVLGYDHDAERYVWQHVNKFETNLGRELVQISDAAGRRLKCTADHRVYVRDRGYVAAEDVKEGEILQSYRECELPEVWRGNQVQAQPRGEDQVLLARMPDHGAPRTSAPREYAAMSSLRDACVSDASAPSAHAQRGFVQPQVPRGVEHGRAQPDVRRWPSHKVMRGLREAIFSRPRGGKSAWKQVLLSHLPWAGPHATNGTGSGFGSVPSVSSVVQAQAYKARLLLSEMRQRPAFNQDGRKWQRTVRSWGGYEAVSSWVGQGIQAADKVARWLQMPLLRPAGIQERSPACAPYRLRQEQHRTAQPDNVVPLLSRGHAWRGGAKDVLDGCVVASVERLGYEVTTYNLNVGPCHNYFANGFLVHNCDDPHNVAEGESEAVRTSTVTWFREALSNRLNSLDESAIVVIMQRVHESDVSGEIVSKDLGYDHLMIPMEYEPTRHCRTSVGWEDPRSEDGELAWPERFSTSAMRQFKVLPYMWSGQYQQAPAPRGGGILKEEWWRPFLADKDVHGNDGRMPVCDYVVVSLDPAYTEKKENDPSGCVVLGVWYQDNDPNARFVVMDAWSKHLEIQGAADLVKRKPSEKLGDWTMRTRQHWGLVEWVAYTCERFRGASRDGNLKLLIEGKASGISVEQLMRKAYAGKGWSIQMCDPKGADKIARVYAIQDMFAEGMVYVPVYANAKDGHGNPYLDPRAPLQHRDWCSDLIWECSSFPKGVHDDRVDALSQALRHIRTIGMAVRRDEAELMKQELMQHRGKSAPALYEG